MSKKEDKRWLNSRLIRDIEEKARGKEIQHILPLLAAIVTFFTFAYLILPAIALTQKQELLDCHYEIHQHTDACYAEVKDEDGTTHTELVCGKADYVIHTHTDECYSTDDTGNTYLVCTLPERTAHVHDEDCYKEEQVLACDKEESEDHTHDESCYRTEKVLVCDQPEIHIHTKACYDEDGTLVCGKLELKEHKHDKECMKSVKVAADADPAEDTEATSETEDPSMPSETVPDIAPAEDSETEAASEETAMPANTFRANVNGITVIVTAEEDTFPAGTEMEVDPVEDSRTIDKVTDAVEGKVKEVCALDISFYYQGKEIEPQKPVQVAFEAEHVPDGKNIETSIVHVDDKGKTEVIDHEENDKKDTLAFEADAFSVYAVVYTVDFAYTTDGKVFEFTMNGDDAISFSKLVQALGIANTVNNEKAKNDTESNALSVCETTSEAISHGSGRIDIDTKDFLNQIETVKFSNPGVLAVIKVDKDSTLGEIKKNNHISQDFAAWREQGEVELRNAKQFYAGDWALISLKPFNTNEELTINMQSGEAIVIAVTDAQDAAMKDDGVHVDTISNPSGTTIDLFNYWVDDTLKDSAGRRAWPGYSDGWYYDDSNDYAWYKSARLLGEGNDAGINEGHMFKFSPAWAGTVYEGTIPNKENTELLSPTRNPTNVSYTNDGDRLYYVGGLNSYTGSGDPRQGLVESTLSGGYPKLSTEDTLGTNGESLAYLFERQNADYKDYYGSVDHLLYVDKDGYYTYDSRDYQALFDKDNKVFELTKQTSDDTEVRGFWPFGQQRFWSGMHMNTQFSMPQNGQVLNPKDELKDMQFEFSGDDDTWMYIDGVLVGDGGGVHNRTEIDINFATGKVIVTGKKDANHVGTFEEEQWLDDIFRAAGRYNDADWEEIPGTNHKRFRAGTYHTFDMFYLERGGGESNLYIHYNLISTDDFTGHKSYEGFADDERMSRNQFNFELIGLDGQYQSVWNEESQIENVTKINDDGRAIMPMRGSEDGVGTFEDPKKTHSATAYTDSDGNTLGGTILKTGVMENGDIRFGSANITQEEMLNCDQGHPSLYRYIIREVVPDDAVNGDGIPWAQADEETRNAGGFVKDQVLYDAEVYYMTARVTSWNQLGADGQTYKAYGLSKTYYTDDTFTEVDNSVSFVDFRNRYSPDIGEAEFIKVDSANNPLPGAEFTLYTDSACTKIAKDLGYAEEGIAAKDQVKTSGGSGIIKFENMAAPRIYYMKETQAPAGYEPNDTKYKVFIESSKDTTKQSKIVVDSDETEAPITKIYNTKSGELSVIKEWQDQNGNTVSGGNYTARVKLQRKHYQLSASSSPHSVNFTIQIKDRTDLVYTYNASNIVGDIITIDWWDTNQTIDNISISDSNDNTKEYVLSDYWDDANHKNRKLTVNNVSSDINVVVTYPSDKDWLFNSEHTPWMKAVSVEGSGPSYELVQDLEFNESTEASHFADLQSPTWNKTWTIGEGKDFPESDGSQPYSYYVVEVDNGGNIISPLEETALGYKLIGYSDNNTEGIESQGVIIVYNQLESAVPIDITIKKYTKANLDNETSETLKGAVFRIEKYTSETYQEKDQSWAEQMVSDDGTGTFSFSDLIAGHYKIVEVITPPGYVKVSSDPTFEVALNASHELEVVFTDTDMVKYTASGGFRFGNTPGASLPHTGGTGTIFFTLLGSLLTLGAGVLLWRRKLI